MASLKLYADLRSQPCRAVYLFLKMNKIPFDLVVVDLSQGEQSGEKFPALKSLQIVPVIDDDGFILAESAAILHYLAKKNKLADNWYPSTDLKSQARLEEYLGWHGSNTRKHSIGVFFGPYMSTIKGQPVNETELAANKAALDKTLTKIENYFLGDKPFLNGPKISVADLLMLCELMQLDIVGSENLYMCKPKIKAWMERTKKEVGPHLEECLKLVVKAKEMYDSKKKGK